MYQQAVSQMQQQIKSEGGFLALALDRGVPFSFLKEASFVLPLNRITLIDSDGTVIYDDHADVVSMENHLDRLEVQEALRFGSGYSKRFSSTTGFETFYYAQKMSDGRVLRTAATVNLVSATLGDILPWFFVLGLLAVGLTMLASAYQTGKIVAPINELDLDDPLGNPAYDEMAPLLLRMNNQRKQINQQIEMLQKQQNEFMDITENMREGLVVLGKEGQVLTINRSAARLFGTEAGQVRNKNLLSVHRSPLLQQATSMAYGGKAGECSLAIGSRYYQVIANPVWEDDAVKGAVLLLFDHTEKRQAEVMRREFTANVSHELKTPLTAIQGYGELMLNGLVKEEDRQEFIRRIYDQANHMINLVENIMKLSRLDEWKIAQVEPGGSDGEEAADGVEDMNQSVDLYACASEVARRLSERAKEKQIEVSVTGDECRIRGNAMLLDEMIVNLCDNAIKYNKPGGKVEVSVRAGEESATLSVKDNGVGIGEEHLDRIFERFYRADQSRSREIEGNGLGLAIVKHIVLLHDGTIEVDSTPNEGTSVTVRLPASSGAA
jgi:two-component system phosphate regulon sensor histidine kinase PhoR